MDDRATQAGSGGGRLDEGGVAEQLVHEEFVDTDVAAQPRSHRAGVLGGLAVVGILLAVLVLASPGASPPKLPAQSVHDLGPVTTVPRSTDATSTTSTTTPGPLSALSAVASPTAVPHRASGHGVTVRTTPPAPNGASLVAASAQPASTITAPVASPPPTTTTTTPPATTTTTPITTTTTTTSCFLWIICG